MIQYRSSFEAQCCEQSTQSGKTTRKLREVSRTLSLTILYKSKPSFSLFTSLERPPPPSQTPIFIFHRLSITQIGYQYNHSLQIRMLYYIANNFLRYVDLFINLCLIYRLISSDWFPSILFVLLKWLIQTLCSCWIGKLYPYKIYTLNAQI